MAKMRDKYRDGDKYVNIVKGTKRDLHAIHGHSGQVVGVLFVPAQAQQRVMLRVLIDDGAVLQVSQIKHAHRSICSHRRKHIATATRTAECDVIHLKANDKRFYTENAINYTILKNLKH